MRRIVRRALKTVFGSFSVQKFLIERHGLATAIQWLSINYLRRYTPLDTRYFRWLYCLEATRDLEGDIVELGVGPGRFLVYCATWRHAATSEKSYYGYDTFEGFPAVSREDLEDLAPEREDRVQPGVYAFYNKSRIEKLIRRLGLRNIRLIQGDLTQTVRQTRPDKISFLYIDCDLYQGYKAGLEALYDRVVPGGIILFDEYEWTREWPGAKRAVDEFFQDKIERPERLPFSPSYYVLRGRSVAKPAVLHGS